jgi:hypothetical protein
MECLAEVAETGKASPRALEPDNALYRENLRPLREGS